MRKFYINLFFAISAQFISTLFSLLMYLVVPKFIGNINYAYWQLFLFYSNYAGFFHLGLADGIYLKLGGKDYRELDFKSLGNQLRMMIFTQLIIGIIFILAIFEFNIDLNRKFVIFATIIYIIIYCIENYLGFVIQAVNKTKKYSFAVIMEKITSLILVIIVIFCKIDDYRPYVYIYLFSKTLNITYLIINTKEIVFAKWQKINLTFKECFSNIKIGSILMFSSIASALILGSGRIIIDNIWGIETFGKISFSISMVNMILLFIRQVSMVMFPALRQVDNNSLTQIYNLLKNTLDILLPCIFIIYLPMTKILIIWLPEYTESIEFLSIILPICIFDARMQVLCNTYFKVLRKEKALLKVNLISMIFSWIMALICGYLFRNMITVVVFMVISIIVRNIISELYLNKIINKSFEGEAFSIISQIIITAIFMYASWYYNEIIAFLIISITILIYLIISKNKIIKLLNFFKNKFLKGKKVIYEQ